MQALERLEQFIDILHIEASAVVADVVAGWRTPGVDPEFDVRLSRAAPVFPGIVEQILEEQAHQPLVSAPAKTRSNGHLRRSPGFTGTQMFHIIVSDGAQDDVHHLHLHAPDARQFEQIVD